MTGEWTIQVERENGEGEGIGFLDGKAAFIPGAMAGDRVRVRVAREAKRHVRAEIVELLAPSPERADPRCPHYGACGGCAMQHMPYARTLSQKRRRVADCLARIGGFPADSYTLRPIAGMEEPWRYRNKGIAPIDSETIGLYRAGSREIVPIGGCLLQSAAFDTALSQTRSWLRPGDGATSLLVRTGAGGASLVGLSAPAVPRRADSWVISMRFMIMGLRGALCLTPGGVEALWGDAEIPDLCCGVETGVSAGSFRQVNPSQAERLYAEALRLADLTGAETAVDAYCGAGILTRLLADRCASATGIEILPAAVEEARAAAAGCGNLRFLQGDCAEHLPGMRCDLLVLDPPRRGCDPAVLAAAVAARPRRIVYISCDPATLARDAKRLAQGGYRLAEAVPVDMFPWTAHVETIVLLRRADT